MSSNSDKNNINYIPGMHRGSNWVRMARYLSVITASAFMLWIWYICLWSDSFNCDFTGNYTTDIVSKPTMIRNGHSANLVTYKSTFNYCDKYNITEYHFTPDIISNYQPKESLKLYVDYFGNIYNLNIFNVQIMMFIFPCPLLFLLTAAILEKAFNVTNYLSDKQCKKKSV